jgi:protease-4
MTHDEPHIQSGPEDSKPAPPPTPQIIIQQRTGLLGRFLFLAAVGVMILFVIGLVGSLFMMPEEPQEKYHSLNADARKKIAIVEVNGPILESDGFVKKQIDRVRSDEDVVAVVLRIDSPGGTVTGADYIYHHLRELVEERSVPLVVSMGGVCASGGYYIAMAVGDQQDALFAEPTTWTGSIGVIIPHFDLSGLLARFNIRDDSVASGPLKQMASPTRPMTEEDRKLLQQLVDESFNRFKEIVLRGRPKLKENQESLETVTTGQIFTANQALELGLIDKIGFIEKAIERAAELAGYDTDQVRCVKYKQPPTLLGELAGVRANPRPSERLDLAGWLDLTAPRAYYLWTWLPTVLSNTR